MSTDTVNIDASIQNLRLARRKLLSVDEKELDALEPASQEEWATNVRKLTVNINKLETSKLITLSEKFKAREGELREAIEILVSDLSALNDAIEIIRVVSRGLRLITNVIGLLK